VIEMSEKERNLYPKTRKILNNSNKKRIEFVENNLWLKKFYLIELENLKRFLRRSTKGRTDGACIIGNSGIGKTCFIDEFIQTYFKESSIRFVNSPEILNVKNLYIEIYEIILIVSRN
jgi:Cdc6-like AAA superfamily ATPase